MKAGLSLLIVFALLPGCSGQPSAVECMRRALEQPGLKYGRVAFGEVGHEPVFVQRGRWLGPPLDAVVPMASLTKPLVAEQVRLQISNEVINLSDPVSVLLPQLRFDQSTGRVTVRQLLQHQAGFAVGKVDPVFAGGEPDCEFGAVLVAGRAPDLAVGEQISYSNAGYCLLGKVLLQKPELLTEQMATTLHSSLGGAGGWQSSLPQAYLAYRELLPIHDLSSSVTLADGSYYAYGWRHWPRQDSPRWTHFGRLAGMLSVAASDGERRLLLAYFYGDPEDMDKAGVAAVQALWACMPSVSDDAG